MQVKDLEANKAAGACQDLQAREETDRLLPRGVLSAVMGVGGPGNGWRAEDQGGLTEGDDHRAGSWRVWRSSPVGKWVWTQGRWGLKVGRRAGAAWRLCKLPNCHEALMGRWVRHALPFSFRCSPLVHRRGPPWSPARRHTADDGQRPVLCGEHVGGCGLTALGRLREPLWGKAEVFPDRLLRSAPESP